MSTTITRAHRFASYICNIKVGIIGSYSQFSLLYRETGFPCSRHFLVFDSVLRLALQFCLRLECHSLPCFRFTINDLYAPHQPNTTHPALSSAVDDSDYAFYITFSISIHFDSRRIQIPVLRASVLLHHFSSAHPFRPPPSEARCCLAQCLYRVFTFYVNYL